MWKEVVKQCEIYMKELDTQKDGHYLCPFLRGAKNTVE